MALRPFENVLYLLFIVFALAMNALEAAICREDICEFTFVIRKSRSMTYSTGSKTYNVELNGTDLQVVENSLHKKIDDDFIGSYVSADDVITADGYRRDLITINDQFPGPTIEVMEGSQVVVHVENQLAYEGTTIHWHGLHVRGTPWMDGTAYITQCPILPRQKFTYRLQADPPGTHWYHSHFHAQRLDGLFGLFIVHRTLPTLPTFGVTLIDWIHSDASALTIQNPYNPDRSGSGDDSNHGLARAYTLSNNEITVLTYHSVLINGRGRYNNQPYPLSEFPVNSGQTYRLHMAHAGAENSLEVSFDGHKIKVVGSDSGSFVHITVDSLIINPGETYEIELETGQTSGKLWFRARTLRVGNGVYPVADDILQEGRAIMMSSGSHTVGDPTTGRTVCSDMTPCQVFNCPFVLYSAGSGKSCIPVADARTQLAQEYVTSTYGLDTADADVQEIFLNFAFPIGSSINARKNEEPRTAMFHPEIEQYITECKKEECEKSGCKCTHIVQLPANKTIQLVMTGFHPGWDSTTLHSIHLHGHDFAVLKMGFAEQNETTGYGSGPNRDILCTGESARLCSRPQWNGARPRLNKVKPPIKDSILVPPSGYVVVRFRTDNPGFWLLHCHQELHVMEGMAMVLNEAPGMQKALPRGFPTCGDFDWTNDDYQEYSESSFAGTPPTPTDQSPSTATGLQRPITCPTDNEAPIMANQVTLEVKTAIGVAFGLVLLGAVLTFLPAVVFICCRKSNDDKF